MAYTTFRLFYLIGPRVIGWKTTPSCLFHTKLEIQARGRSPLFSILKEAQPPYYSAGDPFGRLSHFQASAKRFRNNFFVCLLTFIGTLLSGGLCVDNSIQSAFNQLCLGSLITHNFVTFQPLIHAVVVTFDDPHIDHINSTTI